jgi:ERCC4-type nuclease
MRSLPLNPSVRSGGFCLAVIVADTLPAGDHAAVDGDQLLAVVERKTLENLATSLSDGGSRFSCSA